MLDGTSHGMGLGPVDLVTLAEARERRCCCRKQLLDGVDPLEDAPRRARAGAARAAERDHLPQCAERYIAAQPAGGTASTGSSGANAETYAYPVIGDLPVAAIDTGLVMRSRADLDDQDRDGIAVRGRIEAILDWAKARDYREGENPARWRGHLDKLLPQRSKVAPVNTMRPCHTPSCRRSWRDLRGQAGIAAQCLEFTILTAARTGEAIGARWSEIDLEAGTWTIPAERMKGGKEHTVPLSERAIEILAAVPRSGSDVGLRHRSRRPSDQQHGHDHDAAPHGPRRHHGARLPLDVPRLGGRADQPPEPRGRDGARSHDRGQGRGGLPPWRSAQEAPQADDGLGALLHRMKMKRAPVRQAPGAPPFRGARLSVVGRPRLPRAAPGTPARISSSDVVGCQFGCHQTLG